MSSSVVLVVDVADDERPYPLNDFLVSLPLLQRGPELQVDEVGERLTSWTVGEFSWKGFECLEWIKEFMALYKYMMSSWN